jgi:plasmid stability protein
MIITIELTPDTYKQLGQIAQRSGKSVEAAAEELLTEKLTTLPSPPQISEREQVREVLRAAGLLTELGSEEKKRAAHSTMTLEEAQAALDRAGGQPLSELILEMRGPKE